MIFAIVKSQIVPKNTATVIEEEKLATKDVIVLSAIITNLIVIQMTNKFKMINPKRK
jgi:hypothetical protein